MREIKFRIWDKKTGEMRYNVSVNSKGMARVCRSTGFALQYDPEYEELPVMQFVGLRDKNGKEIYEGDIVKFFDGSFKEKIIREVYFDTELLEFGVKNSNALFHCQFSDEFEVIGNIFENPELLESRK
jgi:uncharacterized phage protein (TIGR01671 family)